VSSRSRRKEEGNVAILAAITIVVMIGFAAFVIDVGQIFRVKNELQNAVDSASLAGARMLNGTDTGIANAQAEALKYAKMHYANSLQIQTADINDIYVETGHWHEGGAAGICTPTPPSTGCFENVPSPDSPTYITAVRVTGYRSQNISHPGGTPNSSVKHFFAQIIGTPQTDVLARAVAIGGGPAAECGFPMVVSECEFANGPKPPCQLCFTAQSDGNDTLGWTVFTQKNPSPNDVAQLIQEQCGTMTTEIVEGVPRKVCATCSSTTDVNSTIDINNGQGILQAANKACEEIENALLNNPDGSSDPQPFYVKVPVIGPEGHSACPETKFTGLRDVKGFATVKIVGSVCKGKATLSADATTSWCKDLNTSAGSYVLAELDCNASSDQHSGGGFFDTEAPHIRLVQ
jgi:hypothetical protein